MKSGKLIPAVFAIVICLPFFTNAQTGSSLREETTTVNFRIYLLSGRIVEITRKVSYSELEELLDEIEKALWRHGAARFNRFLIERLLEDSNKVRFSFQYPYVKRSDEAKQLIIETLSVAEKLLHSNNKTGIGIAILARVMIFGGGITLPPFGIAWPALLWFAKESLGGAGNQLIGGYIVWGPNTGVAIPFVGLEATWFKEGEFVFAVFGFTFLSIAFGENVTQVPPGGSATYKDGSENPTTCCFPLLSP